MADLAASCLGADLFKVWQALVDDQVFFLLQIKNTTDIASTDRKGRGAKSARETDPCLRESL